MAENGDDRATATEQAPNGGAGRACGKPKRSLRFRIMRGACVALAAIAIVGVVVIAAGRAFTAKEVGVRSDWSTEAGDLLVSEDAFGIDVHDADVESNLRVLRLLPEELDEEGFTYYDEGVRARIGQALNEAQHRDGARWTADQPLAVLNPFGTGSNGLYLYFETDFETRVTYTVSVDDPGIADYSATACNVALAQDGLPLEDADGSDYAREHSFQIVGLVPGETNEVTLTVTGSRGVVRQEVTFEIEMPETSSGYQTTLETTQGASEAELSSGLFAQVRTNGYLGYAYFFDNDGVLRYEMVTEGLGLDRILEYGDDIVVCSSAHGIARINGIGQVERAVDLGDYVLHHDINYGADGTVVALAEVEGRTSVEDVVIEIDLETGEVAELVDFTELMGDYVDGYTHVIGPTDAFFWQAGELDWIHLNTVEYLSADDALVVSSRETSTIMKVDEIHSDPEVAYFIGDEAFWEGTPYEGLCFEQVGDFAVQYGQHSVEFDGAGEREGTYYLLMYNNNYWALSARDGYSPDLSDTDVSTDLYSGAASYVYHYLVDEGARTFELVDSFAVPYSSIVSNVAYAPNGNYVVNSGIANVFGEYDADGELIREYAYTCQLQGYRTFKDDFAGFWFVDTDA